MPRRYHAVSWLVEGPATRALRGVLIGGEYPTQPPRIPVLPSNGPSQVPARDGRTRIAIGEEYAAKSH
jgi:hypothetical protein